MYLSLGLPFVGHTSVAEGDHLSSQLLFADLLTTDHFEHVHWIVHRELTPLHGERGLQPFGPTYLQFSSDYYCLPRYFKNFHPVVDSSVSLTNPSWTSLKAGCSYFVSSPEPLKRTTASCSATTYRWVLFTSTRTLQLLQTELPLMLGEGLPSA